MSRSSKTILYLIIGLLFIVILIIYNNNEKFSNNISTCIGKDNGVTKQSINNLNTYYTNFCNSENNVVEECASGDLAVLKMPMQCAQEFIDTKASAKYSSATQEYTTCVAEAETACSNNTFCNNNYYNIQNDNNFINKQNNFFNAMSNIEICAGLGIPGCYTCSLKDDILSCICQDTTNSNNNVDISMSSFSNCNTDNILNCNNNLLCLPKGETCSTYNSGSNQNSNITAIASIPPDQINKGCSKGSYWSPTQQKCVSQYISLD